MQYKNIHLQAFCLEDNKISNGLRRYRYRLPFDSLSNMGNIALKNKVITLPV